VADPTASRLTIRLFGSFEASLGNAPLPRLRTRKGQWLLALLALRPGAEVERAWLAGVLWPESAEATALANLRSALQDLRRALGAEAHRLRGPTTRTLSLDLEGADVDVHEFDAAIARGDAVSLQQALARYRGPLLEDCGEEWVFHERQTREQAYLEALEALASRAQADGDGAATERYLRRALALDPLRESAQRALMQVLAAGGNYAAALLVYRELRQRLHREINAAPDAETTALYQQFRDEARQRAQAPRPVTSPSPSISPINPLPAGETLTFLFTDIEGSVRQWEEHPEAMSAALARHDTLLRQAIEAHGGVVFKRVGDAFCAVFATAPEALAAALAGQRALQAEPWGHDRGDARPANVPRDSQRVISSSGHQVITPLRVRMALHTGAAEPREGDYFGPPLNRVTRLLETGHGGQVLLSQPTYELVRDHLPDEASLRDLGEHRLRDLVRPERVFQPVAVDLSSEFPPLRSLEAFRHNLPVQLTSFVGRKLELETVRSRLGQQAVRLVTLTGPGGTGKTRLALQAATELLDDFPGGVFFVDLAPIRDPDLVPAAIAQSLGVRETGGTPLLDGLKAYLREKQVLLLLDNFEQVIPAAPLVSELLAAAPRLRVLVTSRAVLHLRGEKEFLVPSLSLPDPHHLPPLEALSQYAAVELFIRRAMDVVPDFSVTNENAPAVAEICHRLDGLPLAIELAAARIKLLPPQVLLGRLDSRLKLLTGGARDLPARQQTLRNTIAWSYELLDEPERTLLRRLSVFVGGFSLEAAEAVCCREVDLKLEVLEGVASLVDKSLLRPEVGPDPGTEAEIRFGTLETIREFGLERLKESGEEVAIRKQHAASFLALAEKAEPELWREASWLDRLDVDQDNLRSALEWCVENSVEMGLRLAGALDWFWEIRGRWREARQRLETMLARSVSAGSVRWKALCALGQHEANMLDTERAAARGEESLALCRESGNRLGIARSLRLLSQVAWNREDLPQVWRLGEESLSLFRAIEDRPGTALALWWLGWTRALQGYRERAVLLLEESLAICRSEGYRWFSMRVLFQLGHLAFAAGQPEQATALWEECLAIQREFGSKMHSVWTLGNLARVAQSQGDAARATALLEESIVVSRDVGDNLLITGALWALGEHLIARGENERARVAFEEALALSRDTEAAAWTVGALRGLLKVAHAQGNPERVRTIRAEAQSIQAAGRHVDLGDLFLDLSEYAAAQCCFDEDLALERARGHGGSIGAALLRAGFAAWLGGDGVTTQCRAVEALGLFQALEHLGGTFAALETLSAAALAQERTDRAVQLMGAVEGLRETMGLPGPPYWWRDRRKQIEEAIRAVTRDPAFAAAWAEGRAMSLEQAVAYALEEGDLS
jgi:predicted ATPase/DNA-binding SARP family transcriptional activator